MDPRNLASFEAKFLKSRAYGSIAWFSMNLLLGTGATMSHAFEPAYIDQQSKPSGRGPAIVLAGVSAAGILADRLWPNSIDTWIAFAGSAATFWFLCFGIACLHSRSQAGNHTSNRRLWLPTSRLRRMSAGTLLLGWFCLAAAWHHWNWSCRASNDIVNTATDEPQLVRLVGKVVQSPWIMRHSENDRPEWQNPDRTIFLLECRSIATNGTEPLAVSGNVRVTVDGRVESLAHADIVDVVGELRLPPEPANPGDFDQRAYLRAQQISANVRSKFAEGVRIVGRERSSWDWIYTVRGAVRSRAERLFEDWMGSETAPVAQAMLLGSRIQIDEETRRAFRESGMLHILAISGMNVGLLWSWLWAMGRWFGWSAKTSIVIVLISLPVYAMVTDANPPIVRATVVSMIVAFGQLIGRTGSVANSLALAAIAVLAWNPTDLFNTGAQLSFLAVFAILHVTNWLSLLRQQTLKKSKDAPLNDSFLKRIAGRAVRGVIEANIVGIAIWVVTSPLIAKEFHLVSPIGSLLTVLLIVPVTVMFWIGYSFLLLGLIWSSGFGWLGVLFDGLLRCFLWAVRVGASFDLGHFYVPAPPLWWTIGFYVLTLAPMLIISRRTLGAACSVRCGLAWTVIGLAWGLSCPPHPGVTCTFISVGHGLGVLIECPNGRTVLYDAGGMVGGAPVARTISQTLWATGRSRLDACVISHADGDHCNALPELSRIVAPGGLFVHKTFLDWKQPPVAAAIEQSVISGIKLRLISADQSIVVDPDVSLRVLHPSHEFHAFRDNPNSVVLCLQYAGRRIVLTGDLEGEGLEQLLQTPPIDADVLLSPHHGSLKANPPDLARWATPEYVIVSTENASAADRVASNFGPETQIMTTARHGAIRCHISPQGELRVEPFKRSAGKR